MQQKGFLSQALFKPVNAINGQLFLRLFGVVIIMQVVSYMNADFIDKGLLPQKFLFGYDFFSFVKLLPAPGLKFCMFLIFCSGICIALNRLVLPALITFIICFLYFFLLEKSYYNNHFYMMLLMAFLYCFFKPVKSNDGKMYVVPYWIILLLQIQVVIVYFYGGIAKLSYDWLVNLEPVHTLLSNSAKHSAIPFINKNTFTLYFLTYGGLLFDLCIGFLLWINRTRPLAIVLIIVFNIFNFLLFNFGTGGDIGIFPFFMMATVILFVSPEWVASKFSFLNPKVETKANKKQQLLKTALVFDSNKKLVLAFLFIYLSLQLLLPFRHLLYSGNTSWTGKAGKFAWRMKVNTKKAKISYYIKLNPTDSLRELNTGTFINTQQEFAMADDPVMIWQFAQFMGNEMQKKGFSNGEVYASAKISLNGRPFYPIVDSTLNLLKAEHHAIKEDVWLLPFHENR